MAHNHNGLPGSLDVWLRFDDPDEELATYEANTYRTERGYRVEWYHNAVGQVSSREFKTYAQACRWLVEHGYEDYTVYND